MNRDQNEVCAPYPLYIMLKKGREDIRLQLWVSERKVYGPVRLVLKPAEAVLL